MKYVYCRSCDTVSSLVTLERDVCTNCGKPAVLVPVSKPWQYWAAIGVILGGAGLLFASDIPDVAIRFGVLLPFLAVGFGLSAWGASATKARVREKARGRGSKQ